MGRAKYYSTATGGGSAFNWTGSKRHGRWKNKYASAVDRNRKNVASRKLQTEQTLFKSSLKAWKGNEWAQKALNEAWNKDTKGYRTMSMSRTADRQEYKDYGDQGGEYVTRKGGYMGLNTEGVNQFGHEIAARAKVLHSESIRGEESAKRMAGKTARGGMGARGSTIMTGGHKGVLEEAKTKKQTLIGA